MTRRFAQVTGWPTPVQRLEPAVLPAASPEEDAPIRTQVRRPTRPPLLYFPAVLPVRVFRISLLTCGAKRARTADLLHAIWRQHVHPRLPVQVTVLLRPCATTSVRMRCGTSVLYRRHPRRGYPWRPDECLTSVNPVRKATDAPFGVHAIKHASASGPG